MRHQERSYTVHVSLSALASLLALTGLAVLWQLRPGLPALPESWTSPMTGSQAEDLLFWVVWVALAGMLLLLARGLLDEAVLTIQERREEQIAAFAQRVLPKPSQARPAPSRHPIYADKYVMTLAPRPRPDEHQAESVPAATAVAVPEPEDAAVATSTAVATIPARPSVSLLGPLRIEGLQRPIKRVPTREMIAYLALHPAGAGRDELIDAIWPGQDPDAALQRLYQSATEARKALGQAWVRDNERYQLDRSEIDIDLDQLDQLLAQPQDELHALEAALALWRGAPLAGSDYPWADGDIHRLHSTLLELLGRVSQARLDTGDPRGALQAAEQAIRLDELHEPSWRLALQAEHALGQRGAITKRYQALSHILDEQLGLQPSQETRMVYRRLLGPT